MKNTVYSTIICSVLILLISSCSISYSDLCEYEGYTVHSVTHQSSDSCGCSDVYYAHIKNEHQFQDVKISKSAFIFYSDALKNKLTITIECKDIVELKE